MSFSVLHRPGTRVCGWVLIFVLLLQMGGCYTRQIEGIQSDLDDLDRKIHSYGSKSAKGAPTDSTGAVKNVEDELNQTRMQQAALRDDLTHIQQQLAEATEAGNLAASGPGGQGSAPPAELGQIRKDLAKNQEKTDQLSKEMDELQATFGTLKTETRSLIDLLQGEYGAEAGASNDLVSSAVPPLTTTQIEGPGGPTAPSTTSDVKVARTHRVTPGENLTSIARKYDVPIESLKEINGIDDPNDLRMGQEVYIP